MVAVVAQSVYRLVRGLSKRIRSSSRGVAKNQHFSTSSRPALGSTLAAVEWLQVIRSLGSVGPGMKLTSHF
jgi:hypothetical protein